MRFPPIVLPVVRRWMLSVAILAMFSVFAHRSSAQPEAKKIVPKFGTQTFQGFFARYGLQPLTSVGELKNVPADETLIVILGENEVLDDIKKATGGLKAFLDNGGALLVATDQATGDRLNELGLGINGKMVHEDEETTFLRQTNCPLIRDFREEKHPLAAMMNRGVATNMPSFIINFDNTYRNLATFSANTYAGERAENDKFPPFDWPRRWNRWRRWRFSLRSAPFVVGSSWDAPPAGRVIIMSDDGVFTNLMMHFDDDNDNSVFARQCVDWLSQSPLKPKFPARLRYRKYVVFVENGRLRTKLDGPIGVPPVPPIQLLNALLHGSNTLLHGLEEENFFNRELHRYVPPHRIWQAVILLTTLFLMFWGGRRLMKARFHLEREAPRLAEGLAGYPINTENKKWASEPVAEQRHRTQYKRGNYWEALHQLARHFFIEFAKFAEFDAESPLPFDVKGNGKQRRQLTELWELAVGRKPQPVSARAFRLTVNHMDELAAALEDGTLVVNRTA